MDKYGRCRNCGRFIPKDKLETIIIVQLRSIRIMNDFGHAEEEEARFFCSGCKKTIDERK